MKTIELHKIFEYTLVERWKYTWRLINMATKTFTKEMHFNQKSANQLIDALNNNKSPKRKMINNVQNISDKDIIKKMFGVKK